MAVETRHLTFHLLARTNATARSCERTHRMLIGGYGHIYAIMCIVVFNFSLRGRLPEPSRHARESAVRLRRAEDDRCSLLCLVRSVITCLKVCSAPIQLPHKLASSSAIWRFNLLFFSNHHNPCTHIFILNASSSSPGIYRPHLPFHFPAVIPGGPGGSPLNIWEALGPDEEISLPKHERAPDGMPAIAFTYEFDGEKRVCVSNECHPIPGPHNSAVRTNVTCDFCGPAFPHNITRLLRKGQGGFIMGYSMLFGMASTGDR